VLESVYKLYTVLTFGKGSAKV